MSPNFHIHWTPNGKIVKDYVHEARTKCGAKRDAS